MIVKLLRGMQQKNIKITLPSVSKIEKPLQTSNDIPQWQIAEDYVQTYFEKLDCLIIERHYRTPFGEVDLWMKHFSGFFMIEVKTVRYFEMLERIKRSGQFDRLKRVYTYLCHRHNQPVYPVLAIIENFQKLYLFENYLTSD